MAGSDSSKPKSPSLSLATLQFAVSALVGRDLVAAGRRRGGVSGAMLVGTGGALTAAGAARAAAAALLRFGASRRVIQLDEAIVVERPVREVFAFCRNFENFPRIFPPIRCVDDFENGRSRWEATTVSGRVVRWNAVVTKYVPNVVIAWRSLPGGDADLSGLLRFAPMPDGATRLTIAIRYTPHDVDMQDVLAVLRGATPAEELRAALTRVAAMIPAADGGEAMAAERWRKNDGDETTTT